MKTLKLTILPIALVALTLMGCGSSQAPVVGLGNGNYGYNGGNYYNPYNTGTQTSANSVTYQIQGGTKTVTTVLAGFQMTSGSRNFSQTAQVQAGDQVSVNAYGSTVYAMHNGVLTYSSSGMLTKLNVGLNGSVISTSPYTTINITQPGTLSFSFDWSGVQIWAASEMQFQTNIAGITVSHCVNTSGQAMTCP